VMASTDAFASSGIIGRFDYSNLPSTFTTTQNLRELAGEQTEMVF
jgi:hypothetical protein